MSYPPLSISPNQSRAALLANLRTSPAPPNGPYGGGNGGYPSLDAQQQLLQQQQQQQGPRRSSSTSTASSSGPRLPPHVPQRQQRYPSSEHTLGPSFDDDDEDEEMVAKMAALNAGVYPYGGSRGGQRASASGGSVGGGGNNDRGAAAMFQQQQQQQQHQQQQQQQQQALDRQHQELVRVALQLAQQQGNAGLQNGRGMSELQILQALQSQQQQREVEAQMEQLLKIQQAQNLQQQLIAQARQAAILAEQPYGSGGQARGYSPSHSAGGSPYGPPPPASQAQAQAQALYQAQLRANAQQQQQGNSQQLASAYEQRHAAQQQIQANLRARSAASGGGAPPLPPPGGNGPRFGFESNQDVHDLAAQFGRTTMAGGPYDSRSGLRSGSLSPTGGERFGTGGAAGVGPRMASPLSALHPPAGANAYGAGGSFRSDSPNGIGSSQLRAGGRQQDGISELPPPHSVGGGASIWGGGGGGGGQGAGSGSGTHPTSPWQQHSQAAPLQQQQQQQQLNGRPSSGNGASRFASSFAQQQQQQQQALDARSGPSSSNAAGSDPPTLADRRSPAPPSNDALRPIYEGIGLGRPHAASPVDRTQSMSAAAQLLTAGGGPGSREPSPGPPLQRITSDPYGRPASQQQQAASAAAGTVTVLRQPIGPPSVPDELGSRNFASRLRKQAGSGLSLLGRREGSIPA